MSERETSSPQRAAWLKPAVWIGAYLWLAVLLSNFPARSALARHQAQFGLEPFAYAVVGLAVDTVDFFAIFVLVNLLVASVARLVWRRRLESLLQALRSTLVPTTTILVLGDVLGSVWAAEHKIERGLYPTMFEFANATDAGFALAGAKVFFLSRFSYVTVSALLLFAVASFFVVRRLRCSGVTSGPKWAGSLVLGVLAASLACFGCHRASPLVVSSIPNWRAVESPLQVFVSMGVERENVRLGALSLFKNLKLADAQLGPGADLLGYPRASIERYAQVDDPSQCEPHPAADPIVPPVEPKDAAPAYDPALALAIDELSLALFDGRDGPVRVWMLALESLRADDIHALHERAHPEVAPFTSGLYDRARAGSTNVIVAEKMMQAGGRTSQGLAALACGIGTMPYGLSSARDLGLLPLRCLPDVLKDASFRTAFYYGSNPSFDNMLAFLNFHGFERIKAEKDYEEEIPHQGWSVPDAIVFTQAFEESEREPASQSQFNFAMSLTNHFPFGRPEDFPAEVGQRIERAVRGQDIKRDDVSRLETYSYTDWAFAKLVKTIEGAESAKHTFVVASADHSTTDYFLWRGEDEDGDRAVALTHIPFVVVLPDAFIEGSPDPERARKAVTRLNELLAKTPMSQNDVPRLVLGMLMHSRQIQSLPEAWRWHNLGGQRLSPNFRVPGHPEAVTVSVDGTSMVCLASADGTITRTQEASKLVLDVDKAMHEGETLRPSAAVFAAIVQGYGKHCWEASRIRQRP